MNSERPPIHALTGLRFFAAMQVVFFHYAPVKLNGELAVSLFFILSGFVLAYNYAGRTIAPRKFWLARFARIYPAYFLGFVLIAPAVAVRLQGEPLKLAAAGLASGSLLQSWIPGLEVVWNGPGWSLSNEAFFYLLFPMLMPAIERFSRWGLWIAAALCCVAAALASHSYFPLFRLPEFILGIATGLLFLKGGAWRGLLLFSLAGLSVSSAAPLFALMVYALAADRGPVTRLLSSGPMSRLGDASYAVYILQSPVMAYFLSSTQGLGSRTALGWGHFAVYSAILIAVSMACFSWWEGPARRWILSARSQKKMVPSDPISSLAHHRHARY